MGRLFSRLPHSQAGGKQAHCSHARAHRHTTLWRCFSISRSSPEESLQGSGSTQPKCLRLAQGSWYPPEKNQEQQQHSNVNSSSSGTSLWKPCLHQGRDTVAAAAAAAAVAAAAVAAAASVRCQQLLRLAAVWTARRCRTRRLVVGVFFSVFTPSMKCGLSKAVKQSFERFLLYKIEFRPNFARFFFFAGKDVAELLRKKAARCACRPPGEASRRQRRQLAVLCKAKQGEAFPREVLPISGLGLCDPLATLTVDGGTRWISR